jgi:hypothetical protein
MSYLIKTITSDVKVSTDIISSITGSSGLTVILGDNVCLDLQYGCYSIYIGKLDIFPLICADISQKHIFVLEKNPLCKSTTNIQKNGIFSKLSVTTFQKSKIKMFSHNNSDIYTCRITVILKVETDIIANISVSLIGRT